MSAAARSMQATTAAVAARADARRRGLPNGWWGALLFLATEVTLFGTLIGSYFYLSFQNAQWPPTGVPDPKLALPLVLTGVLLAGAVPVVAAVRAARRGRVRAAWWLLALAFAIQAAYLAVQIHEFLSDLDAFSPEASAYGAVYFTLLFTHHAHVAVGLLLEAWLLVRLRGGVTNYRFVGLRIAALYACVVAAVAIPVVLTQTYPAL
jgi:heme/copper-type cytochrome/quinol oxidase subunit 3